MYELKAKKKKKTSKGTWWSPKWRVSGVLEMRSSPGLIKLASGRQRSYRLFSCGERQETNVQGGRQATNWNHAVGKSGKGYHHPGYVLLVVGPRSLPRAVKLKGVHLMLMIYKPDTNLLIWRREYILPTAGMLVPPGFSLFLSSCYFSPFPWGLSLSPAASMATRMLTPQSLFPVHISHLCFRLTDLPVPWILPHGYPTALKFNVSKLGLSLRGISS